MTTKAPRQSSEYSNEDTTPHKNPHLLPKQLAAKEGFVDRKASSGPSRWDTKREISQTRNTITGKVNDIMASEPLFKLPPLTVDKSFLEANDGYNFNNATAKKEDVRKWSDPISQDWLDRYNKEMQFKDGEEITMEDVMKSTQLRRIIAQFSLQDKADAIKAVEGPRPVPYHEIPVRTPIQPQTQPAPKPNFGQRITSLFSSSSKPAEPQAIPLHEASVQQSDPKQSLVARAVETAKNVGSKVSSAVQSAGKALSKLKFW